MTTVEINTDGTEPLVTAITESEEEQEEQDLVENSNSVEPPIVSKKKVPTPKQNNNKPKQRQTLLDGNAAFADALKGTIPGQATANVPAATESESGEDDVVEEEEGEEEEEEEAEDDEEDEDEESKTKGGKKEDDGEDEDMKKLKLLDEINQFIAQGYMPPQSPSYTMASETLKKILAYQQQARNTAIGVGLIGYGWVNLFQIIEAANERFDPCGRLFGKNHGLKLAGAAQEMEKNLHLYREPFKCLWEQISTNKVESPYIMMALVTAQILQNVHVHNVRKEVVQEADYQMRNRESINAAQRMANSNPPPQAEQIGSYTAQPEQEKLKPVDEIIIPDSEPESDEKEADISQEHDDDVVVQLPKQRSKSKRGRRKDSKTTTTA
jgi:hypothetical protein